MTPGKSSSLWISFSITLQGSHFENAVFVGQFVLSSRSTVCKRGGCGLNSCGEPGDVSAFPVGLEKRLVLGIDVHDDLPAVPTILSEIDSHDFFALKCRWILADRGFTRLDES